MRPQLPLRLVTVLAVAGLSVLSVCGSDDSPAVEDSTATTEATTSTTAADATTSSPMTGSNHLEATLTGAAEVPGPGDPDGTGTGGVSLQALASGPTLCYQVTASGIDAPTAAHIHKGATGVAGDVVVTLATPVDDGAGGFVSSTCVDKIDKALQDDIFANPQNYYVNVHTKAFPKGALRGQLAKKA